MFEGNTKIRMLVVDDDPEAAGGIERLLCQKFSASVDTAENISGAKAKIASNRYDVMILDYQLPDGNGLDLLRHVSANAGRPRVIIVTGHGDESIAREAFRLNAFGYVAKDGTLNKCLCEAVTRALNR